MEKDFLPYELAVKLKAIGFDKKCITTIDQTNYIHIKGTRRPIRGAMVYNTIDCPTFSQAFRWFRENYRLSVVIQDWLDDYGGEIVEWTIGEDRIIYEITNRTDTYEEAEIACLTKLIEIVESNSE